VRQAPSKAEDKRPAKEQTERHGHKTEDDKERNGHVDGQNELGQVKRA
jgi:hypothetical protein